MGIVFSQNGLKTLLTNQTGPAAAPYPAELCLFTNDRVPTVDDVVVDYSEPGVGWYARKPISNWTPAVYAAPYASLSALPANWVNTNGPGADLVIYGYFALDSAGNLIWAERDPAAPVTIAGAGGTYTVAVGIRMRNP